MAVDRGAYLMNEEVGRMENLGKSEIRESLQIEIGSLIEEDVVCFVTENPCNTDHPRNPPMDSPFTCDESCTFSLLCS